MNRNQTNTGANILLVDDNPDSLRVLAKVLTERGHIVRSVSDGNLALKVARKLLPDLILLDVMMPSPDGYEVCQQLKANALTQDIPIIFISGKDEVFHKVKAFSLGSVDYITKPFYIEEVLVRVENQLKIWRLQKQLTQQNSLLQKEISDRVSAETALKESESKYRALVESADDAIFLVNPATGLTCDCNLRAVELFEANSKEELLNIEGHTLQKQRFTPEELTAIFNEVEQCGFWHHELEYVTKQGNLFWGYIVAKKIYIEGQRRTLIRVADITKRKHKEKLLKLIVEGTASATGREFFHACVRYLAQVLQVRYALVSEFANEAKTRVRTLAFWMGTDWSEQIEYELADTPCENLFREEYCYYPENLQVIFPKAQGLVQLNAQSYFGTPLINSQGNVLGHLCVLDTKPMARELDEKIKEMVLKIFAARAAAELERKQVEESLIESQSHLSTIISTNADGLIVVDPHSIVRFVNPAACRLLGCNVEEIMGNTFVLPTLVGGTAEVELPHSTRGIITIEMRVVDIIWEGVNSYLASLRDITERKQAENAIHLLLKTTQAISRAENVNSALTAVLRLICITIGWDFAEAWIPSKDGTVLEYSPGWYGRDRCFDQFQRHSEQFAFAANEGLPGYIWSSRQPQWIEDVSKSSIFRRSEVAASAGLKTGFGVPIIANDRVLAVLTFFKCAKIPKDLHLLDLVNAVAAQLNALIVRKKAEESLRESERLFRAIFNCSFQYTGVMQPDGTLIKVNQTALDFAGLKEEDIIGLPLWETLWWKWSKTAQDQLKEAIARAALGEVIRYEVDAIGAEDAAMTIDFSIKPVFDDSGEVVLLIPEGRDISDRKQAEEALRENVQREKAIARVIQKMRQTLDMETIFHTTTSQLRQVLKCDRVVVYRFNPDWSGEFVCESVANAWKSLLHKGNNESQLTASDLNSENCAVKTLSLLPYKVTDTYLQQTQGGVYSRSDRCLVIEDIYDTEFDSCYINFLEKIQARSYIIVPIFCYGKLWGLLGNYQNSGPRQWSEGEINIVFQIGIQLGVALQQAELLAQTQKQSEALQQAVKAADAANRAKSEFLANMSHELRTPLNAILGFAQVMSRDSSLSQEQQGNLEIINRAGAHLLELINDILEMSKIEAGRTVLNVVSFDLIRLLKALEEMLRLKAQSKKLQLIFEIPLDVPRYVQTDEGKLRQVLINILGNAIKFTKEGRVTLRVMVSGQELPRNPSLFFEIEDSGPGIAPNEIARLFEAFVQTETGRKLMQGTGLGLAISRKFVQLMGGDIKVSSQLGKGSLFAFNIQVSLAETDYIQTTQQQPRVIGLAPHQPKYRILVVDDHLESRSVLVTLLAAIGFDVCEASNGQEAVTLWSNWKPHLICMDIRMPQIDGLEATQQIRAREHKETPIQHSALTIPNAQSPISHTVIIALTANAFEEDRKKVLSAGCDDFISKPLRQDILLEKVSQYLGVLYIYEEKSEKTEKGQQNTAEILTITQLKHHLQQMPAEWVAQLHKASCLCDDNLVLALLAQVPPEKADMIDAIADLANNFQFDKILELTQDEEDVSTGNG